MVLDSPMVPVLGSLDSFPRCRTPRTPAASGSGRRRGTPTTAPGCLPRPLIPSKPPKLRRWRIEAAQAPRRNIPLRGALRASTTFVSYRRPISSTACASLTPPGWLRRAPRSAPPSSADDGMANAGFQIVGTFGLIGTARLLQDARPNLVIGLGRSGSSDERLEVLERLLHRLAGLFDSHV